MEKEIENALSALKKGQLLLYPTDTVWGIGCDPTSSGAVQKVYALKEREESKALICLVSSFKMLKDYVSTIPDDLEEVLRRQTKPTTVIYQNPIGLASNLIARDKTLAIRICQNTFCQKLIERFGKPIVSTSANISGEPTAKTFSQITSKIKAGVNYIVNLQQDQTTTVEPSKIIKIEANGVIKTIRE